MATYNVQINKYNATNASYDQLYPKTTAVMVEGLETELNQKAPTIQYGTTEVEAGSASTYPEGTLYVVIE